MDELQGDLPSMRMPGQAQVNAQFRSLGEGVGIVAQEDVGRIGQHQAVDIFQIAPASSLVIDADYIQTLRTCANFMILIPQNAYTTLVKTACQRFLDPA